MSETPLNEIRIDQGPKTSEIPSWLSQILQHVKDKEPKITKSNGEPKIPMVSSDAGVHGGRECYVPLVVSIGPYHYSDRTGKLSDVEKLKAPMTRQLLERCGRKSLEKLCTEVRRVSQQARTFYDESIIKDFNDDDFMKMMFIDGCFIVQFINCIVKYENEKLDMTDRQVAYVKRDLLLIENQLPFSVLKSIIVNEFLPYREYEIHIFLRNQIFGPGLREPIWVWVVLPILLILFLIMVIVEIFVSKIKHLHLSDKISCCCHGWRICPPDSDQDLEPQTEVKEAPRSGGDNEPAHLLGFLYSEFIKSGNQNGIYSRLIHGNPRRPPQVTSGHYLYCSAKNLKRVGIHFQPSRSWTLTDLEFTSSIFFGTLKIPPVTINESTRSLLLNLAAHEESTSSDQRWVASYICFMDSLINDAEDVEELRSKGILFNYLGADQEVADLFNEMGKYLKPDASTYNDVIKKINKQGESSISKWVAEWQQKYFKSPWTVIAVLAAASGLALTAAQTYYAKYSSCK